MHLNKSLRKFIKGFIFYKPLPHAWQTVQVAYSTKKWLYWHVWYLFTSHVSAILCCFLLTGHQVIYDSLWSQDFIGHQCKCQQIIDSISHDSIEYGWNFNFFFFKLLWFINVFQFSLLIPINSWYQWPWACRYYNWIFFNFLKFF